MENILTKLKNAGDDDVFARGILKSLNTDVAKVGEETFKKAYDRLCERWENEKKEQKDWQEGFWKKVDITDNFSLVPKDESLLDLKRKDLTNSFINQTIDLSNKKIKQNSMGTKGSGQLSRVFRLFGLN